MSAASSRPGTGALDRLERLLLILPRAQRPEGVTFDELEEFLEVDRTVLRSDLKLLTSRTAYLRAGDPADFQLEIDAEQVRIVSSGTFERPPRLGDREALALVLGLRTRALLRGRTDGDGDPGGTELLRRFEGLLARRAAEELDPLPLEDASARPSDGRFRDRALDAIAARAPLRILYLKPGARSPDRRRIHPLTVVHAEGRWYLMGQAPDRATDSDRGIRSFRFDRILELTPEPGGSFTVPADFDPHEHLDETRAFSGRWTSEVTVDYSPGIARWIEERLDGRFLDDGRYRVVHRVADREWFVRHVLQYGGEAVAHEPGRAWVVDALSRNREGGGGISEP